MDNGVPTEALEILDGMIADLHSRRATLAEVANSSTDRAASRL
ncbi:hypothetical protein GCM10029964_096660 [Kibdelosporangium lantanae]